MSLNALVLVFIYVFLLIYPGESTIKLPENLTVPAVMAFGDSIFDQGNNNYIPTLLKANFPPYGQDFVGKRSTGRFSNAKTPIDLIAEEVGIKEFVPAYLDPFIQDNDLLTGVSFASGGSGLDPLTATLNAVIPITDQMIMLRNYILKLQISVGKERAKNIITNGLYLVAAGTDDFIDNYFNEQIRKLQYDIPSYVNLLVSKASNFLQEIYNLGARRVLVLSLPPIGCLPTSRTLGGGQNRTCADEYNNAAQLYNNKLHSELLSLRSKYPDFKAVFADIYNPLLDMIENPHLYGYEIVNIGCCGTGKIEVSWGCNLFSTTCSNTSKFLFWDSFHPTEKGYKIIVHRVLQKHANELFGF